MSIEHPYFGFFPALPLASNLELGEWIVGTPGPDTPWAPNKFRELAQAFRRSFESLGFKDGAQLWHRDRGFDGSKPTDTEIAAIRAGVTFAVLDANDRLREADDGNKGHDLATTENAELYIQPIDEANGRIVFEKGGLLKSTIIFGMKIGDKPPPLPNAVESIGTPVPASQHLAKRIFETIRGGNSPEIEAAAKWHRAALVNPSAIDVEPRLVFLKTGFEQLLGTSYSWPCAGQLRELFERTTAPHRELLPWRGLLWSPTERTDLHRIFNQKPQQRTELEDWFMALADARNHVVHKVAKLISYTYPAPTERPMSRYAGGLFWKGERILREAIKAKLGADVLLCGPIAWRDLRDAAIAEMEAIGQSLTKEDETAEASPAEALPVRAPRTVADLETELGCPANHVVVDGVGPTFGARRYEKRLDGSGWGSLAVSMSISEAERDLLLQAGAEEKLPDHLMDCE